ncbi:uncharacterized protein LOC122576335 [Bombus pyrosoma]|uniref:uncharacterized protein LOC122576335 n=1 Tax=Bombus pyrosoma TaxID=396416 RepID=UPI001CB8A8F8|nr:uncharacterized protein LOC122576335 [Bombus pyrosoma]
MTEAFKQIKNSVESRNGARLIIKFILIIKNSRTMFKHRVLTLNKVMEQRIKKIILSIMQKSGLTTKKGNIDGLKVKHEIAWFSHISNTDPRLILLHVTEQICQRDDRISA